MIVAVDSFDPYDFWTLKWSSGNSAYNTNPAFIRTCTQSLNPSGASFGDQPRINFGLRNAMVCGVAFYTDGLGGAGNQILGWFNQSAGFGYGEVDVLPNGSIQLKTANTVLAVSVPSVITTDKYFYIQAKADFTATGGMVVSVNGVVVINYSGPVWDGANAGADGFILFSSKTNAAYFDDFYLNDTLGGVNDDFLGAVQIFAILPDANETPLDFTPLTGTNFSEVNQAPPPGDTAYVFSNASGATDQYHYTITGPSGSYSIKGIQHSICCRLDSAGAHSIASQINTHTSGAPQVGTSAVGVDFQYKVFPWDTNPNTGLAFQPTDFATTFVGPKITS